MATMKKEEYVVAAIATAILETVKEAGPMGAPGGVLYLALMSVGISLSLFETIMSVLVKTGKVTKRGQCYFIG